jgi:glycosyltransferase involved in cell wall biosynthesis
MKICNVTKLFPPSTGGAEMYWYNLSKHLGELGHDVDVWTQDYRGETASNLDFENVSVNRVRTSRKLVNLDTIAFSRSAIKSIDFSEYDVIHGSLRPASTICLSDSPVPVVLTSHGTAYDACIHTRAKTTKDYLFKYLFQPLNFAMDFYSGHHADKVIAVSNHVEERLIDKYRIPSGDIEQITPGLDTSVFYPRTGDSKYIDGDKFTLLFVGRIEPIKGLDLVLEAISELGTNNIELVVVGEGDDVPRLQSLSKSIGIEDMVEFVGRIDHENLPEVYSSSDLLVLPSEYESLSFVVREAMACGLPALCADVGGVSTSVTHDETGFLVSREAQSFRNAISEMLSDPEKLNRMSRKAAETAKDWSWTQNARDTVDLYRQVI